MSINLAELASRYLSAGRKQGIGEKQLETLAQVGVGLVKREIQNYHAVDTSTMLNSTTAERVGKGTYFIGPTVDYAPYVALGTSRMPARPFHISAMKSLQGKISQGDILRDMGI